jgi:hypothetical protein
MEQDHIHSTKAKSGNMKYDPDNFFPSKSIEVRYRTQYFMLIPKFDSGLANLESA